MFCSSLWHKQQSSANKASYLFKCFLVVICLCCNNEFSAKYVAQFCSIAISTTYNTILQLYMQTKYQTIHENGPSNVVSTIQHLPLETRSLGQYNSDFGSGPQYQTDKTATVATDPKVTNLPHSSVIRLVHLQCESLLFWSPHLSSVCLSRIRFRKLSKIGVKFCHLYKKSGLLRKNTTSDFAPEVAKYPKSNPKIVC